MQSKSAFDVEGFLRSAAKERTATSYRRRNVIFSPGDAADSVLYIQKGTVKLSVLSKGGKEAVVGILDVGDFFGERALTGHPVRLEAATAVTATTVLRIPKQQMVRLLHEQHAFSDRFIAYMLARNIRIEADLVDQLFNASEKRLARALLLLAGYGKSEETYRVLPRIPQETLADDRGDTFPRELLHEHISKTRVHPAAGKVLISTGLLMEGTNHGSREGAEQCGPITPTASRSESRRTTKGN